MTHDISGKWKFTEEFECGIDEGYAYLSQDGEIINGYLEYKEAIEDEESFMVKQVVSGTIHNNQISLKGDVVTSPDGSPITDYNLDTMQGTLTHEGKIVGHSFDSEDICGVFVLTRE
ncbi:MAG TPA: hypothetical protein DIW31_06970 [Bacteroidales bacterium]|nr:hypothetical protein [Bacteroidales bacterium]